MLEQSKRARNTTYPLPDPYGLASPRGSAGNFPPNFGPKLPPKARNRNKADFATKVRKSSINHVNVNHEQ